MADTQLTDPIRHEADCRTHCRTCGGCSVIETVWVDDTIGRAIIECALGHVWEEAWLIEPATGVL